jgi:hypothetical protein
MSVHVNKHGINMDMNMDIDENGNMENTETYETWKGGDMETRRHGNMGDLETC